MKIPAAILIAGLAAGALQEPRAGREGDIVRRLAILAIEDRRDPSPADLRMLLDLARGNPDVETRRTALRALGRLEQRDLIPALVELLQDPALRDDAAVALTLTLRAHAPAEGGDEQIERAVDRTLAATALPAVAGHLPYSRAGQVEAAEERLRGWLGDSAAPRAAAARGLEALARRNRRLGRLNEDTIALLKRGATWQLPNMDRLRDGAIVFNAFAALSAAGALDEALVEAALGEEWAETRRLGALALGGTGAAIDPAARTGLTRQALRDRDAMVRYEALRAWVRRETVQNGCAPISDALSDASPHVALAAIDAFGDRCPNDDALTTRLVGEVRTPPPGREWHREAHALVSLAKRAPDLAEIAMPGFISHQTWQVRMYAARAAALMKNAALLERLAYDAHDNVREAALPPLRTLKGTESDAAFIAALGRGDYQLLRTAALALKGAPPSRGVLAALVDALQRVTAERKETSRDTRLALMDRIREQGGREQATVFERLLKDFDPRIASAAADACTALTGRTAVADPQRLPRPAAPTPQELSERLVARVELDTGRHVEIVFDRDVAPLAYVRFARLVRARYYDGLTFHRVVPNYVIQGGSPGANEYAGDGPFMRDELGAGGHHRGAVGISTRGHHTGDAQIFVNLVDNRTLDFDYTVLGRVRADMAIVDAIVEGTTIRRIRLLPPSR